MEREKPKAVVGPFTTVVGGAERVKLEASKAFCSRGYSVVLAGIAGGSSVNLAVLGGDAGLAGCARLYGMLPWFPQAFGLYQAQIGTVAVERAVRLHNPQTVFIDTEGSKGLSKLRSVAGFKLIKYIHFPHSLYVATENCSRVGSPSVAAYCRDALLYSRKYFSSAFWGAYWAVYLKLWGRILPEDPFSDADIVMANSEYTGRLLEELYGEKPVVVHPPVPISDLLECGRRGFDERDDAVAMVGRISSEKRHDDVIRAISETSAKPALRVMGALTRGNVEYATRLRKLASKLGVRLELHPNIPREKLAEKLCSSKVFVHATIGEHFGMAVVEAMAAGLPVVATRHSGSYRDIVSNGRYGLGYSNLQELAHYVDALLQNKGLWIEYHERSLDRCRSYDSTKFYAILEKLI